MATEAEAARRAPLSRERVVRAAVALADERGLDRLSMRELGRRVGVEAMSLYNHVAHKDDLLDAMVDLVVGEIEVPSHDVEWKESMRRRATSARAAFARHAWAARLIHTRSSAGPVRLRYFETMIGCLRRAGFSPARAVHALSTLDGFVHGFGVQRLHVSEAEIPDDTAMAEALAQWLPPTLYPYLNELLHEHVLKGAYDEAESFAFGIDLILDGLEARLKASTGG